MGKESKLEFKDIEFIMQVLEEEKASTTDQEKLQTIEAILEKIKKSLFK